MSQILQATAAAQAGATSHWLDLLASLAVSAIGAAGIYGAAWVGKRRSSRAVEAEIGDQIAGASEKMTNSWTRIVAQLEQDNEKLGARLGVAEATLSTVKQTLHDRNGWIMAARGWVDRMLEYVHDLESQILALGGQPPPRPAMPDLPPPPPLPK